MFYDLGQKTLGYEELCGRCIHPRDLFNVASNYAYALFGVARLMHDKGTNQGKIRYYKCYCCTLRIQFDLKRMVFEKMIFMFYILNPSLINY